MQHNVRYPPSPFRHLVTLTHTPFARDLRRYSAELRVKITYVVDKILYINAKINA